MIPSLQVGTTVTEKGGLHGGKAQTDLQQPRMEGVLGEEEK